MKKFLKELADLLEKHDAAFKPMGADDLRIYVGNDDYIDLPEPIVGEEELRDYVLYV